MNLNKIGLLIALNALVLYSCTKNNKSVSVVLKKADVLYSVPDDSVRINFPGKKQIFVLSQENIKSKRFCSNVSLSMELILKNNCDNNVVIQLNDLNMHTVSFELTLFLKNRTLKFYNYPFSLTQLPANNSFLLRPKESKMINLESPIFYYSENFDNVKLDSIVKSIKKNNFKIEKGNENAEATFELDSRKMMVLSKPNKKFPNYPNNGAEF